MAKALRGLDVAGARGEHVDRRVVGVDDATGHHGCWAHARRPFFALADIEASARRKAEGKMPDATMRAGTEGIARDVRRRLRLTAPPIPRERLHVSLLSVGGFSGSCPPAVIDAAMRAAGTVSMAPFRAEFDRVASLSASHGQRALVLTGDGDGVAGFMRLQEALKHALMKAGMKLPRQSGSSPHLTMMYDENRTCDFPIEPIGWTVSRFVLVDSQVGQSRHVHLGQWSL